MVHPGGSLRSVGHIQRIFGAVWLTWVCGFFFNMLCSETPQRGIAWGYGFFRVLRQTPVFRMTGPGLCPPPANQACSGGSGGFPPGSKKGPSFFLPRSPPFVSRSLFLSLFLSHSLLLLPFPWLLFSRTLPTRQADPPYPAGGPPLPDRRALFTRQADPPYPAGGPSLLTAREADTPYSRGGYSLLGRRILPTRACGCWCGVLA